MTEQPRVQTQIEVLIGTRDSLRFLLGEVEGAGLDEIADAIKRAVEAVEVAIRRWLS